MIADAAVGAARHRILPILIASLPAPPRRVRCILLASAIDTCHAAHRHLAHHGYG
jgi:hypothetical protein